MNQMIPLLFNTEIMKSTIPTDTTILIILPVAFVAAKKTAARTSKMTVIYPTIPNGITPPSKLTSIQPLFLFS